MTERTEGAAASAGGTLPILDISTQDDPRVLRDAAVDDFAGHIVPDSWRASRSSLTMAWFAVMSAMFWLVFAGTMSLLVGTRDALIGMVVSAILLAAISSVLSRYAAQSGQSLSFFSRRVLGYWGGAFASLVVGVTAIYYCAFEASVIALAFQRFFTWPSLDVWYFIMAACGVALAIGGVRVWLAKFNGWMLPVYGLGVLAAVIWSIVRYGYSWSWLTYLPPSVEDISGPGWVLATSGYLSQLVLVMYLWDFARQARKDDAGYHAKVTFGLPFWIPTFLVNGIIGIFLAHTIQLPGPLSDTSAVIGLIALMGIAGVLLVWVTQSRINTANFYVSSMNLQSFGGRMLRIALPRTVWVAIVGVIVFVLMLTDVLSFLLTALNYQTTFVAGWVAIALVHVLIRRGRMDDQLCEEFRPGRLPLVNWAGFSAWVVASVVGVVLLIAGGSFGQTWTIPLVFVLAGLLYLVLDRLQAPQRAVLSRPNDPRTEVGDVWRDRVRCALCHKHYLALEMDRNPAAGYQPICTLCAERNRGFSQAARREARATTGTEFSTT